MMTDISQQLTEKADKIVEEWVKAVSQDRRIQSTDRLSPTAVRDHIPVVLKALSTVLSRTEESNVESLAKASLEHGALRAEQGFDPTEIAREYHLLRSTIVSALQDNLLSDSVTNVIRAFVLIDAVIDEAIAQCFKSYVRERLQELEQLQTQLTLTNQELNRLVSVSQDNLSYLAHELKTPLNSIIGYSELVLRQQKKSEVKDSIPTLDHLERVLRNGRQLLHLINNALELSRYESGQMQLNLTRVDVRSVIDAVLEVIQPLADAKNLQLIVDVKAPILMVTDAMRLQQILTNLLSNAVRYTEKGTITIACQLHDCDWSITIRDTGIGISPEDQSRIFEPYVRVVSADHSHVPGSTGLGLAIVARLVKLLQGKISLTSEVGVGSTFVVSLPIAVNESKKVLCTGMRDEG
ncbi:sensor histidine kinase [Phormidesmis sp. 146-33]